MPPVPISSACSAFPRDHPSPIDLMYYLRITSYLAILVGFSAIHAGAFDDFFRAVRTDNSRTVAELLSRGFDPNTHEESGQSALTLAVRDGSAQVIDALIK